MQTLDMQYRPLGSEEPWFDLHSNLGKEETDYWLWFYKSQIPANEFRAVPHDPDRPRNLEPIDEDDV